MSCPALSRLTVCNQVKCSVPCHVSTWSEWSVCSRPCSGGVRGRARTVLQQPKHGGEACGAVSESQPCNSGACISTCDQLPWSNWSNCSAGCGDGIEVRSHGGETDVATAADVSPQDSEDSEESTCEGCAQGALLEMGRNSRALSSEKGTAGSCPKRVEERHCSLRQCQSI